MDAKKIWSYARRLLAIIPSIFICALGVALLVWPEWGCDPLTTFEIGLSNVFHVQFGTVALVFEGIMFFVFFFVRRDLVHLGTLAWCFLIGRTLLRLYEPTGGKIIYDGKDLLKISG